MQTDDQRTPTPPRARRDQRDGREGREGGLSSAPMRMTPEEIQAARGQAKLDAISEIVWEIRERIQDKRNQRAARERKEAAQDAAHHVAGEAEAGGP
jgi:hypothetical protein